MIETSTTNSFWIGLVNLTELTITLNNWDFARNALIAMPDDCKFHLCLAGRVSHARVAWLHGQRGGPPVGRRPRSVCKEELEKAGEVTDGDGQATRKRRR